MCNPSLNFKTVYRIAQHDVRMGQEGLDFQKIYGPLGKSIQFLIQAFPKSDTVLNQEGECLRQKL